MEQESLIGVAVSPRIWWLAVNCRADFQIGSHITEPVGGDHCRPHLQSVPVTKFIWLWSIFVGCNFVYCVRWWLRTGCSWFMTSFGTLDQPLLFSLRSYRGYLFRLLLFRNALKVQAICWYKQMLSIDVNNIEARRESMRVFGFLWARSNNDIDVKSVDKLQYNIITFNSFEIIQKLLRQCHQKRLETGNNFIIINLLYIYKLIYFFRTIYFQ